METIDIKEIKMNVATLCAYMGMNTDELADACNISRNRLSSIRAGRSRMLGVDLIALSDVTGIPVENIQTDAAKQ